MGLHCRLPSTVGVPLKRMLHRTSAGRSAFWCALEPPPSCAMLCVGERVGGRPWHKPASHFWKAAVHLAWGGVQLSTEEQARPCPCGCNRSASDTIGGNQQQPARAFDSATCWRTSLTPQRLAPNACRLLNSKEPARSLNDSLAINPCRPAKSHPGPAALIQPKASLKQPSSSSRRLR